MNHILILSPLVKRLSIKIDLKIFWILSFILTAVLLLLYIFQQSSYILESYQVQNYQKKLVELSDLTRNLEIKLNKISYLEDLSPKLEELGLERTNTIHYVQVIDTQAPELATKNPGAR